MTHYMVTVECKDFRAIRNIIREESGMVGGSNGNNLELHYEGDDGESNIVVESNMLANKVSDHIRMAADDYQDFLHVRPLTDEEYEDLF